GGHVGPGHGEDVVAEVHLPLARSCRDELRIRDVARMAARTAHVSEPGESLVQPRTLAAVCALQLVRNERRALEVRVVCVGIERILEAGDGRRGREWRAWKRLRD